MDDDAEMRPCARGTRCSAARSVQTDDGWERVPASSPRPLCDADRERVRQVLADLPGRYVTLWSALGKDGRVRVAGDGGGAGKAGSRVPLNLEIDTLMTEMIEVTSSWEWRVRTVAHLTTVMFVDGRRNGRVHRSLAMSCALLHAHLDALLALTPATMQRARDLNDRRQLPPGSSVVRTSPVAGWAIYSLQMDGTDAAQELLNLSVRARGVLREGRAPQHLEVRCVTCGQRTLQRYDGWAGLEDEATCTTCGDVYSNQRYLLLLREEHEFAVTAKKMRGRRPRSPRLHD